MAKNKNTTRDKETTVKMLLLLVIIILIVVFYRIFDTTVGFDPKIELDEEKYYQYFYGVMQEYSGKLNFINENDNKKLVLEDGKIVYLDTTPIYYKEILGKALFANKMELVIPNKGVYKLDDFTQVIQENNNVYLKKMKNENKTSVNNAFIFDGNDLYFFLDEIAIKAGDQEYNISPLSYVIVNYKDSLEIYDYNKNEYIIIDDDEILQSDIIAINRPDNYIINMSVDSLLTQKSKQLLISNINNLSDFNY